jgi:molybdopterin molybdotransferase
MIGGASRGDRDLAKSALAPLGLEILFSEVALKPGKPAWYGKIEGCHVIGLPGNPTAAMTVARLFLVPLITALGGRGFDAGIQYRSAPIAHAASRSSERDQFLCGRFADGAAHIIDRQAASSQATLADTDWLVRVPRGEGVLAAGSRVDMLDF